MAYLLIALFLAVIAGPISALIDLVAFEKKQRDRRQQRSAATRELRVLFTRGWQ